MIRNIVLKFCFVSFAVILLCCTEEKDWQQESSDNEKTETSELLGNTNVVMKDGTALGIELTEQSKFVFTEGQLVIKTNGKETKYPLSDIYKIVYKK